MRIILLLVFLLMPIAVAQERPVVLVHGSFTGAISNTWCLKDANETKLASWSELQSRLVEDTNFTDGGIISFYRMDCPDAKKGPPAYLFSYYESCYEGQNATSIYTNRLSNAIKFASECAGGGDVDVVAHSLGGLLLRNYARNESELIGKAILLSVPNTGISIFPLSFAIPACILGKYSMFCPVEFKQMMANSPFLKHLNEQKTLPAQITTIWSLDDRVVAPEGPLWLNSNKTVQVSCYHDFIFRPTQCPEAYTAIIDSLTSLQRN